MQDSELILPAKFMLSRAQGIVFKMTLLLQECEWQEEGKEKERKVTVLWEWC